MEVVRTEWAVGVVRTKETVARGVKTCLLKRLVVVSRLPDGVRRSCLRRLLSAMRWTHGPLWELVSVSPFRRGRRDIRFGLLFELRSIFLIYRARSLLRCHKAYIVDPGVAPLETDGGGSAGEGTQRQSRSDVRHCAREDVDEMR